mmetsp:Transcript_37233/g.86847  ORF Transcript_37233/g.86847 Transcript_37233/m.86847 type:complete len:242 (-) Transcript_37233:192-917(-)
MDRIGNCVYRRIKFQRGRIERNVKRIGRDERGDGNLMPARLRVLPHDGVVVHFDGKAGDVRVLQQISIFDDGVAERHVRGIIQPFHVEFGGTHHRSFYYRRILDLVPDGRQRSVAFDAVRLETAHRYHVTENVPSEKQKSLQSFGHVRNDGRRKSFEDRFLGESVELFRCDFRRVVYAVHVEKFVGGRILSVSDHDTWNVPAAQSRHIMELVQGRSCFAVDHDLLLLKSSHDSGADGRGGE